MNFNTSDYFAYKKNKIQSEAQESQKPVSRLNLIFQLFLTTFIIFFIAIVIFIMKYSSKMDIEYSKGDLSLRNPDTMENFSGHSPIVEDEQQRKIDSRLLLIQQEENAPSEAKIIEKEKVNSEVIDPVHIDKDLNVQKTIKPAEVLVKEQNKVAEVIEEISGITKKTHEETLPEKNVTIMSKVLIGRYSSFDEAKKMQTAIKVQDPSLTPFVRKVGDVFSVQMGSFQDFSIAKSQAQKLKSQGFDVWIYQQ